MTGIIGIDPGIIGGWALIGPDGALISAGDLPVAGAGAQRMLSASVLSLELSPLGASKAIVEQVSAMPKQGVSSSFKFGRAVGIIEGVIAGLALPIDYVTPAKWKKHFSLPADKEAARQGAIRRWPAQAALFKRKMDHGRAEAALIALYAVETQR